ncbi:hypothetical protein JW935_10135 [candidate division KSB1 bacterium]|nr:hypothetical protein [candidate division KSB1 bacterium]
MFKRTRIFFGICLLLLGSAGIPKFNFFIYAKTVHSKASIHSTKSGQRTYIPPISYGPEFYFNDIKTEDVHSIPLSKDYFLIAFQDDGNDEKGAAVVGHVSGKDIVWGEKTIFNGSPTYHLSAAPLSSQKFVIAYQDFNRAKNGVFITGTSTDGQIVWGNELFFKRQFVNFTDVTGLSENLFIVAYQYTLDNNTYIGAVRSVQLNGQNISLGDEVIFADDGLDVMQIKKITDSTFVLLFEHEFPDDRIFLRIGQVKGQNITLAFESTIIEPDAFMGAVAAVNDTSIVVAYNRRADQSIQDYRI